MGKAQTVAARKLAREARARLDEQRQAREQKVDAKVVEYLVQVADVADAQTALEEATAALQAAQDAATAALADVAELEPDENTLTTLTGATPDAVTAARKLARERGKAAKPTPAPEQPSPSAGPDAGSKAVTSHPADEDGAATAAA